MIATSSSTPSSAIHLMQQGKFEEAILWLEKASIRLPPADKSLVKRERSDRFLRHVPKTSLDNPFRWA